VIALAVLCHDQRLVDMAGGEQRVRVHRPPLAR
jgi:hypothetical protein